MKKEQLSPYLKKEIERVRKEFDNHKHQFVLVNNKYYKCIAPLLGDICGAMTNHL